MTDITHLLTLAAEIMVLGMGIVFAFLTLLIFCVNWMSALINRYFPDLAVPAKPKRKAPAAGATAPAVVAAATAAVQMHRNRNRS